VTDFLSTQMIGQKKSCIKWQKSDGMEITEEIKTYIDKAKEMYNETGTVPAVRVFAKEFGMDRKASKLYEVFKSGPMKIIAKYGGLPKPTGCV